MTFRPVLPTLAGVVLMLAVAAFPASAGPPGPPNLNPPPVSDIACLLEGSAGQGLLRSGQFSLIPVAPGVLVVAIAKGTTIVVTYRDGDGDGFHCDDVATGTDAITSITVNAP